MDTAISIVISIVITFAALGLILAVTLLIMSILPGPTGKTIDDDIRSARVDTFREGAEK